MSFYASYPPISGGVPTYSTLSAFPSAVTAGNGALALALDTDTLYVSNGTTWVAIAQPGDALFIGSPANGLAITANALTLALSSTSTTGALSNTDWNTFNGKQNALSFGNLSDGGTDGITITGGIGAVIGSGTSIAQHVADSVHNGYLSATDWSTFNSKQNALTLTNITDAGTDGITITNGTGAVIGASPVTISQHVADSTHNGYLSSTDWNTFSASASLSIGALDAQAANANGLALVANVLSTQSADATHPGMVNNTTQTMSGAKTFSSLLTASNILFVGNNGAGSYTPTFSIEGLTNHAENAIVSTTINPSGGGPGGTSAGAFYGRKARGSISASLSGIASGDIISDFGSIGYGTSAFSANVAYMQAIATQNFSNTAWGTQLVFGTTPNSSTTPATALTLNQDQSATFANTVNATTFVGALTGTASGNMISVSVASANGFAGSSSGGQNPALTLTTSITGILKGNGTAISAATAGTDYSAGTSGLASGILQSTTGTGVLSIATTGNLTDVGTDGITITGGTGAVLGSGTSINQHVADTTHNGYLSSTDWNTFSGKQATVTIGALDAQAANANGLALVSNVLSTQSADATHPGMINNTTQTFSGTKTFSSTISGSITGTAGVSTLATTTTKADNVNYFLTFVGANSSSNQAIDVGPATYNPSTSTLTATTFVGALSGNATTATTATNATNIATTATNSSASTFFPVFVASSSSGNQGADTATGLTFVPSTNTLTATTFVGALTGTASGNTTYTPNQFGVVLSGAGNAMTVLAPDASTTKVLTSGGTGANPTWAVVTPTFSGLTQFGAMYANTTTTLASTAAGTAGYALVANTSAAPTFQQLSLTAGVTGVLPIANGGTNNGSLGVTAGGALYTDGSKLANIGAGSSGQVFTSQASSAPIWAYPGMNVTTANGNQSLTANELLVYTTGNGTATLPTAVGISGNMIGIIQTGTGVITLNTTSSQTVGGYASGKILLATKADSILVVSDGSNWQILHWGINVSMIYAGSPVTGSIGAAVNKVTYGTKTIDTYSAYASGDYTVVIAGTYSISASLGMAATYALGNTVLCGIGINGTRIYQGIQITAGAEGNVYQSVATDGVHLNVGDTVQVYSYNAGTSPSYIADSSVNWFNLVRTGS